MGNNAISIREQFQMKTLDEIIERALAGCTPVAHFDEYFADAA